MSRTRVNSGQGTPGRLARLTLTLFSLLGLGACAGPGYYTQAVSGHLSLMHSREPIPEVIERLPIDDPTASQLRLVQEMLEFAETRLALPAGDSYQSFVPVAANAITWNVVATPPFDLAPKRWCFIIAGCVPYRGYFDDESAERFAGRLRRKGLDVAVSGSTAYSTLGWFDDPVLETMLRGSEARLAGVLFHELAHQRVYVPGATRFNESYATFVEREAVRAWLQSRGDGDALARWQEREQVQAEFLALLRTSRRELLRIYARDAPPEQLAEQKTTAFDALEARYRQLVDDQWAGRDWYGSWFEPAPNNADLALLGAYTGGLCAFERLWAEAGGRFSDFHPLVRAQAAMDKDALTAWLNVPCDGHEAG